MIRMLWLLILTGCSNASGMIGGYDLSSMDANKKTLRQDSDGNYLAIESDPWAPRKKKNLCAPGTAQPNC